MHLTHLGAAGLAPYDLVIVGSSFAALPLAIECAPRLRVLLVDGGDVAERDDARSLTANDEYGHFADGHWATHWIRAVGGTSRRWSGVVVPLDDGDFLGGRGRPAWPITRADLDPAYRRAAVWLGRPPEVCAAGAPFGDALVARPLSHDTPVRLPDLVMRLTASVGIDLLTRHTLVRLQSTSRKAVEGLVVTGPARHQETLVVHPRQTVVLACGGLGNAQILLQPSTSSGVPIGNESGLAGRFLMEHPHVIGADVLVNRSALPSLPDGFGPGLPAFGLLEPVMARHDLLSCSLAIQGPIDAPPDTADVQRHFEASFGVALQWAALFARAEQEPAATNRVDLLPETNWAGSHRLRTHCSFSSRDLRSIETSVRLLGEAFTSMRIGVARLHNHRIYRETFGGGHTMGTTRMGTTVADSVCDATLRVHGYDNLYLAGSSVFPTGGAANPTLTIAALSFRLADHLRARMA
jgi:choline dehydrogenase-like flavoprotein